jgi:aspartate/methionine/tyrosine aminotransferase
MKINKEQISNLFDLKLSDEIISLIENFNLNYDNLNLADRDAHILKCINFLDETIVPSGKSRKPAWENGWGENFDDFYNSDLDIDKLLPHYYRRGRSVMRLQGDYILPEDHMFEAKILSIIQAILAENFLGNYNDIYEFGAGPCHNIVAFAQRLKNKNFYVTDWVDPTVKIIKHIEANKDKMGFGSHNFNGSTFDYFNLDHNFKIKPGSVVLTWGSMEQIGSQNKELLNFFLSQSNVDFIHIEPTLELYQNTLFDQLAHDYSTKRNYLNGYFKDLFDLEASNKVNVTYKKRIIGSGFNDSWTIICWNKVNRISNRSKKIKPQPMFEVLQKAKNLENIGKDIIHLEIGDSSSFENTQLHNLVKKNLAVEGSLQYSPSGGESRLKEAFIYHYSLLCNYEFSKEEVVVTPANAAISQLFTILADENDCVLLPDPGFPTYLLSSEFNSLKPIFYPLLEKNNFQFTSDKIIDTINKNPLIKIVVINNPSNPLGVHQQTTDINEVVEFCAQKNVAVIWDDTYRNLIYDDNVKRDVKHCSNLFYIYSLSKDTAAPALRIGCVIGDKHVIKKITQHNSMFFSCLPKFIQLAAADYLFEDHRPYRIALRDAMMKRIDKICEILNDAPLITYVKPNAGIYFFLNISRSSLDGDSFADQFLRKFDVCVCPGFGFGPSGKDYVRICISGSEDNVYEGTKRIVKFFNSLI